LWSDLSLALKQTHQSHRIQDVNPFILKFEISILLTVWHKFVCSVIVLYMKIWCYIKASVLQYRKSHSLAWARVSERRPRPLTSTPCGGFMQGGLSPKKGTT